MQVKTSDLSGIALDWTVACSKGYSKPALTISGNIQGFLNMHEDGYHNYSVDWSQAGPIIEREGITLRVNASMMGHWDAFIDFGGSSCNIKARQKGSTVLVAAMRCYVASKLGDVVEVPEELVLICN